MGRFLIVLTIAIIFSSCSESAKNSAKHGVITYAYRNPIANEKSRISDTLEYKFDKSDALTFTLNSRDKKLEIIVHPNNNRHTAELFVTDNNNKKSIPLIQQYENTYSVGKEGFGVTMYRSLQGGYEIFFCNKLGLLYMIENNEIHSFFEYPDEDYYLKAKAVALNIFSDPFLMKMLYGEENKEDSIGKEVSDTLHF